MKRQKKRTSPERQTVFFHLTDALIPSLDMMVCIKSIFPPLKKSLFRHLIKPRTTYVRGSFFRMNKFDFLG